MRRARAGAVACAWALALAIPGTLLAQGSSAAGAGVLYQTFSFDDADAASIETLSLLTLPFSARVVLTPWADLSVDGAWARGTLDTGSESSTISSLIDTQVSLGVSAGWARVTAIALLPTGLATQTLEESRVAGAIAADLLPFAVSNWGGGAGGGVNVSAARPLGPLGIGLAVAYLARESFEPLEDEAFAYRPGNLLRITAAVDGTVGSAGKATAQVTYHSYGDDELDSSNLFRSGDRFQALGSYAFPLGTGSNGLAYAGFQHRGEGHRDQSVLLGPADVLASQDLILLGGGFRIPAGSGVFQPDVEARFFSRSDEVDQGFDVSVGAEYEFSGGGNILVPSARVHFGRLEVRQGVESGFTGFEVGLAARVGGGR